MKQRDKNKENLMKYGISEKYAEILTVNNFNVTKLRTSNKKDLASVFNDKQIKEVKELIKRKPITDEVFEQIVDDTELQCCFCWNIEETKPTIIHHIEEYNVSQNNDYDNLVVVCLNHHAEIHTKRQISQQNFPPIKIIKQREKFIQALKDYRAGNRVAPGKENLDRINLTNSPNSVITVNQTGGQAAQTIINQRIRQRALSSFAISSIQAHLSKFAPIQYKIWLSSGDDEQTNFANSLKEMLEGLNWENVGFKYNLAGHHKEGFEIAIGKKVEPVHQTLAYCLQQIGNIQLRATKYNNVDILTLIIGPHPNKYLK